MTKTMRILSGGSALALVLASASPAIAAGTTSGTTITNTVTVNYQVGGVAQTARTATDSFTVDRRVNVTVARVGTTSVSVSPGQTNAVASFTVQNTSNAAFDFGLTAAQAAAATGGLTDNLDYTGTAAFYLDNGDNVFNAATDTLLNQAGGPFIDNLAADATARIHVVVAIPTTAVTGDVIGIALTARAQELAGTGTTGAAVTASTGADGKTTVETVLADAAAPVVSGDVASDGRHSANHDFTVAAADIRVVKTSRVISDPINGTTNPKAIPGATVQYCIVVHNFAGSASATNVTISDAIPSNVTYSGGFGAGSAQYLVNGNPTGAFNASNQATWDCDTATGTATSYTSGPITGTLGTSGTLAANTTRTVAFRVTVN